MVRNRNYKRRNNYPNPIQRLDDILVAEINLAIQLGLSDDIIVRNYHITYSQLSYCKNKKLSFKDIYEEEK